MIVAWGRAMLDFSSHVFETTPLERGPKGAFTRHSVPVSDIVVHYSWTLLDQLWDARRIHDDHTRNAGYNGIGYHFVILLDGTIQFGRPLWARGAHVRRGNNGKIGICWIGGRLPGDRENGYNTMTAAQEKSLRRLITQLKQDYPDANVNGHRDHVATQCPAFDVAAWWAGEPASTTRSPGPAVSKEVLGEGTYAGRPTLSMGDHGAFVVDAQDILTELRYAPGEVDGKFGRRTRTAVQAFQADHGIGASGAIDAQTWEAMLKEDQPVPERDASVEDLRGKGSRTISEADKGQAGTAALVGVGTVMPVLNQIDEVTAAVEQSSSTLDSIQTIVMAYWPVLLVIVLGVAAIKSMGAIKSARVDDARKGRNLGR